MKVLIIHHLEPMWETSYKKFGTSMWELSHKMINHIKRAKYDKVILTQMEEWKAQDEHFETGIASYVDEWHDYGYGWEYSHLETDDDPYYTKGGEHSEYVFLADWMKELKGNKVSICGAFDGECIEDLEIALKAVGVPYRRVESLIV